MTSDSSTVAWTSDRTLTAEMLQAAFCAAEEGMVILGPDGTLLSMNQAFERLSGMVARECLGRNVREYLPRYEVSRAGYEVPPSQWVAERAIKGESVSGIIQSMHNRLTGQEIVARFAATPIIRDGQFRGSVITAVDVTLDFTTREAIRAQNARFDALLAAEDQVARVGGRDYRDVAMAAVEGAMQLTGADGACLEILDGDEMVYEATCGIAEPFLGMRIKSQGSLSGLTMRDGIASICDDSETDPRVDRAACRRIGIRSMALVPLRYDATQIGVLKVIAVDPHQFSADDSRILDLLGAFLGASVGRARVLRSFVESESQYRQIAEAIPQIVWTTNAEGTIEFFNGRWFDFSRADRTGDLHRDWLNRIHPEDQAMVTERWRESVETGDRYQVEYRIRSATGDYRWVLGIGIPICSNEGKRIRWFGTLTDIQDRKEAETELERRVIERTAQLKASNEALEGFSHHVAHDLRGPLRSIVSAARIAVEDYGATASPALLRLMERQADSAKRMSLLIDDLLEMARLSRTEAVRTSTDLTALAREAATEALTMHPESTVKITVEANMGVDADPRLLKLALANLIENAVKYSPDGGTVRCGQRSPGVFFVSDEGIGIDGAYLERIFEPFQRLHREDRFKGTGIGLSNVRQIVTLHGGRVWAESEPDRGTTFLFTLNAFLGPDRPDFEI